VIHPAQKHDLTLQKDNSNNTGLSTGCSKSHKGRFSHKTMPVVRIEGLTKVYKRGFWGRKVPALKDLNLEIERGEIFGFLGPNGAGKTTTLKILLRIIFPTEGRAWVLDREIDSPGLMRQVGYMPENPYFYRFLTGEEFLYFYASLGGFPRPDRKRRIDELIHLVGLDHARGLRIGEYSRGMTQRIGLAQALLHDPEIIFMDEPLSGLDPIGRHEMRELVLSLRERGKTIFFCSHILSDVESICERVAILHRGRLRRMGAISDLLESGAKAVEVKIRGGDATQLETWKARAIQCSERGGLLGLSFPGEAEAGALLEALPGLGAQLVSLQPRRETLEEYFMQLIGKEGADTPSES